MAAADGETGRMQQMRDYSNLSLGSEANSSVPPLCILYASIVEKILHHADFCTTFSCLFKKNFASLHENFYPENFVQS